IGTGIGNFFLYYPAYRAEDFSTAGFMAHNDPLQFAVEMGLLAPVLFYALLIMVLLRTLKSLRGIAGDNPRRLLILAPFFALAALVLHAHISFHFHVLALLMASGV